MPTYADIDADFIPRYPHTLTDAEKDRAELLLEDASFWLNVWVPGLDAAITGGDEQITTAAKLLVVAMVKRELLDPVPETSGLESETIGPFTRTYRGFEGQRYAYDQELAEMIDLLRPNRADAVAMRSPGL